MSQEPNETAKTTCKRCGAPMGPGASVQGMCTRCLIELGMEADSHVVITGSAEAPAPPPDPAELAPLFPQHEILELLGQGGMGVVYRARQKELGREVALKILPASAGRDPAFAERFAREARALAKLSHPNIVSIFDFGKAGEHYYLVMELVDGVNLRQMIKTGTISPKQALQIVEQVCDALQYAHDEGVVHRDIKPENILADRKGRVKITDFGLAKVLGRDRDPAALTLTHQVMGTPHYMAPEQVEHPTEVDHRADIFSLGVVFYELLTGELPLGRFTPPSQKVEVNVRLDDVVLKALEKEPKLRYQSASEVRTDVHGLDPSSGRGGGASGGGGGAGAGGGHHGRHRSEWHQRNRKLVVWLVVLLVAVPLGSLAILGGLLLTGLKRQEEAARAEAEAAAVAAAERVRALEASVTGFEGGRVFVVDYATFEPPTLSPAFVQFFRLDADAVAAADAALARALEEYQELERSEARTRIDELGRMVLFVPAFEERFGGVMERLWADLETALHPEAYAVVRERGFPDALTPYSDGESVSVAWEDGEYLVRRDGETKGSRSEVLWPPLRWYWDRLFHAPPPSAQEAVALFLDVTQRLSTEGKRISVLRVDAVSGGRRGRDDDVHVKATLELAAGDTLAATELLSDLVGELALRRPGTRSVRSADSRPLDDGTGILVPSFEVELGPGPGPSPRPIPRGARPLDVFVRSTAAAGDLGELSLSERTREPRPGVRIEELQVAPGDKRFRASLERILVFLEALETGDPDSTVTEVDLDLADLQAPFAERDPETWSFDARLSRASPAEG